MKRNPQINLNLYQDAIKSWRLSVAPMLDVTDRHSRYFHRLLAPHALLYTEMVTTGALIHGNVERHLQFNVSEHPVALQLGGSEARDLAYCARLGQDWGYDEINLNCGCPSERVQKGAFGACLMREPTLVSDCIKAMQDAVSIPVTVKHRLGIDYDMSYSCVQDFVASLYEVGCRVFITHARNAVLKGLSPKENRGIPPLRYEVVTQLNTDFPEALFILNGGLMDVEQMKLQSQLHDGIMIGRSAWQDPYKLRQISEHLWPDTDYLTFDDVIRAMQEYAKEQVVQGISLRQVIKPMLGLFNGKPGARRWRRELSDQSLLSAQDSSVIEKAYQKLTG